MDLTRGIRRKAHKRLICKRCQLWLFTLLVYLGRSAHRIKRPQPAPAKRQHYSKRPVHQFVWLAWFAVEKLILLRTDAADFGGLSRAALRLCASRPLRFCLGLKPLTLILSPKGRGRPNRSESAAFLRAIVPSPLGRGSG